jgi:Leucine-rich repeat (LRR) protein
MKYMTTSFKIRIILVTLLLAGFGCGPRAAAPPAADQAAAKLKAELSAVEKLDLSNGGLISVPSYVFGQFRLQELNLSHNKLTGALPAEVRHLTKLRQLDASDNAMTGVPAEIGQLSELRVLNLSNNRLTGLPHELANLKNLEELDLSGNAGISEADLKVITDALPNAKIVR